MRDLIARSRVLPLLTLSIGLLILSSVIEKNMDVLSIQSADAQSPAPANANPLLANWAGPYGGVPPFDRVQIACFKPALEAAMAENLDEVEKIVI